jgi:hypothetical protein
LALMKASRSSLATVLSTLDMAHRMATGLYEAGEFLAFPPPLYTEWISAVLKADGKMPAASNMLTRWEMGRAKTLDPLLRMATGIPSVPSADVDLSPVMTFAILPAFAKPKEKIEGKKFPLVTPSLEVVALSGVRFSTPLVHRLNLPNFFNVVGVHHIGGLKVALRVVALRFLDRGGEQLPRFAYRSVHNIPEDGR